jgi:circadian clock protein KaiC
MLIMNETEPPVSTLVSTGIKSLDAILGGEGYPPRSAILVYGTPDAGKEGLGYWFAQSGLHQGDLCVYASRLPVREIVDDMKGFGVSLKQEAPFWISSQGGEIKFEATDILGLSVSLKEIAKRNSDRKIRIVTDVLSPLLVMNPLDTIYGFLSSLFADLKQYNVVLLATLDEGMHDQKTLSSIQELFDGIIEYKLYEESLKVLPLLRIRKMRGIAPRTDYLNVSFVDGGMDVSPYVK